MITVALAATTAVMTTVRKSWATWAAFALAFLTLAGCAGAGAQQQAVIDRGFPSKDQLADLVRAPLAPREVALKKGLAVDRWELAGPFPDKPGSVPWNGEEALARSVAQRAHARKSGLVLTESMQCYAREIGRFVGHHGQLPEDDLQAFAAGRCGVVPITPSFLYGMPPEEPSDPAMTAFFDEVIAKAPAGSELGVWKGSGIGRHVHLAAFGVPKVKLASIEPVVDGGRTVRVRGTILDRAGWLRAYTTAGSMGFHSCETARDAVSVLPEFDVTCHLSGDDAYAVFDMMAAAPEAVLGRQVLMLVLPTGEKIPSTFQSLPVEGVPAEGRLFDKLNGLRVQLGRTPLREAPAQSQTAHTLIPHYFAAADKSDLARVDFMTLGMMAGWDVPGPLRESQFLSFRGTLDQKSTSFFSQLLFFPSNRAVLLDPDARQVALGTVRDEKKNGLWGVLTTYTPFERRSYREVETDLIDELDRQRAARGKRPVVRIATTEVQGVLEHAMEKLARGDSTPLQGLEQTLRMLSRRTQRPFNGRLSYAMAIDGWRPIFEGDLVHADDVAVACKVGFYAAHGHHWGQYVSYMISGTSFEPNRRSAIPRAPCNSCLRRWRVSALPVRSS